MPNAQSLHIDKLLTNISIGYSNEEYIADKIFLPVPVQKQSDIYPVYGKEMFRRFDDRRAPGTEANEITWSYSKDTYYCDGHALRALVTDEEVANEDDVFDIESDATENVTNNILLNKEYDAASKLLDARNYASDLSFSMGSTGNPPKWSDYLTDPDSYTSDPVLDIQKAKERMHKKGGIRPNTLILSEGVMNVLRTHPRILKLFAGIAAVSIATEDQVKMALGVDKVIVGRALKTEAEDFNPVGDLDYIWGNSAILCYIPPKPGKRVKALGYTFMWDAYGNGSIQTHKWYERGKGATIIEVRRYYDHKIVSNIAGFLFADAVTPLGA